MKRYIIGALLALPLACFGLTAENHSSYPFSMTVGDGDLKDALATAEESGAHDSTAPLNSSTLTLGANKQVSISGIEPLCAGQDDNYELASFTHNYLATDGSTTSTSAKLICQSEAPTFDTSTGAAVMPLGDANEDGTPDGYQAMWTQTHRLIVNDASDNGSFAMPEDSEEESYIWNWLSGGGGEAENPEEDTSGAYVDD